MTAQNIANAQTTRTPEGGPYRRQIVAFETDLLEYGDIFDGSTEIDGKVETLKAEARAELVKSMGAPLAVTPEVIEKRILPLLKELNV